MGRPSSSPARFALHGGTDDAAAGAGGGGDAVAGAELDCEAGALEAMPDDDDADELSAAAFTLMLANIAKESTHMPINSSCDLRAASSVVGKLIPNANGQLTTNAANTKTNQNITDASNVRQLDLNTKQAVS